MKRKRRSQRIIALLLALTMAAETLPGVRAAEVRGEPGEEITEERSEEREKPHIIGEEEEKRTENEKRFVMSDGTYMAVVYDGTVHYREEDGSYKEIDNRLEEGKDEEGNEVYKTKQGAKKVKLSKKASAKKLVTIKEKEYKISWGYEGASKAKAEVKKEEKPELSGDEAYLTVSGLTSETRYVNAFEKVDLEYIITPEGVKENLILKEAGAKRSYRINYQTGGKLRAEQTDERTIELRNGEETVYRITTPEMTDASGEVSKGLRLRIIEEKNGKLEVELEADGEWLDEPGRAYPVTVDPSIIAGKSVDTVDSKFFMSTYKDNQAAGTLYVGYQKGLMNHTCSAVKFELPDLVKGDMVVNATMYLLQSQYDRATTDQMQINVYEITSNVSWATSGRDVGAAGTGPSYVDTILDYAIASKSTNGKHVQWDITKLVKKWYNGTDNKGVLLRPNNYNQYDQVLFGSKYAASASESAKKPALVVTYINNKGLEDYWDYTTLEMGSSGTTYINNYTGNLVSEVPLTHSNGENMPVSVSMIYNGYQAGAHFTNSICGCGWKLNYDQRIYYNNPAEGGIKKQLYDAEYHYSYVDADGTLMYLKHVSGKSVYEDELGKGYTFTALGTTAGWEMKDKNANVMKFDSGGKLTEIHTNQSNDKITLSYNGTFLKTIKDGAGKTVTIERNANNAVTGLVDPYGRRTTLEYSGSLMNKITYPDGKYISLSYDGEKKLTGLDKRDGSKVAFTYPSKGLAPAKGRVETVKELSTSGSTGNMFTFNYSQGNATRITDHKGRVTNFTFDNYGRTTSVIDETGAAASEYTATNTEPGSMYKNNKLSSAAGSALPVNNLLKNHSFESARDEWGVWCARGSDKFTSDATGGYLGQKSIKQTNTVDDYAMMTQNYWSPAEGNYTFSIYAKTSGMTGEGGVFVVFKYIMSDGTYKEYISKKVKPASWERLTMSGYVPAGAARMQVMFGTISAAGTAWFDCAQLEKGEAANDYNLLENSFFENGTTAWSGSFGSGEGVQNASNYSNSTRPAAVQKALVLKGSYGQNRATTQTIPINLPAKDVALYFGGYACAQSVPMTEYERIFCLDLRFNYADGSTQYVIPRFNPSTDAWQYTSKLILPSKDQRVVSVTVFCLYYYNANSAAFSGLDLHLDKTGTVYSYDSKGNVVSAKDNAKREALSTIDDASRLTRYTDAEGTVYTYDYDSTFPQRVKTARHTYYAQTFDFTYNSHGQITQTAKRHNTDTAVPKIQTNAAYSSDGSQLISQTDQLRHTKNYGYNNKGLLQAESFGGGVVNYSYNASDQISSVTGDRFTQDGQTQVVKNTYAYERGYLSQITHNGFAYNFSYDGFGNPYQTKVGTQVLMTNTYGANNGPLTKAVYGNGAVVEYIYDRYERLTQKKQGGALKYEWTYDAKGQIAGHRDLGSGKSYTYAYDMLGRLIKSECTDGSQAQYTYDKVDRTTGRKYVYNGTTRGYSYGFFQGGAAKSASLPGGAQVDRALNGQAQVKNMTVTTPAKASWKTDYNYYSPGTGLTSDVIGSIVHNPIGLTIRYEYDSKGNIAKIYENGAEQARYTYDRLGQLTREDNKKLNKTIVYEYDAGGNLQWKKEYVYTTGALGIDTRAVSYGYDTVWKDKLTSYNGESISYDAIGNPLSYRGGMSLTWANGRQLATLTKSGSQTSYSYNADGIRAKKVSGGITTEYALEGSRILGEKVGNEVRWYHYDSDGTRLGMEYGGETYYYYYNAQGDVLGLFDKSGGKVVEYVYDSWGKLISTTGSKAGTLGAANPFRYRGYYYDSESGLYYLNSRYYDPETGRFVNADGYVSTGQGLNSCNMFAYCGNNPISCKDPNGSFWISALIVAAFVVVGTVALSGCSAKSKLSPEPYKSADEAAMAFANSTYSSSKYIRHEYGTIIYSSTINGKTTYNYAEPVAGDPHSVGYGKVKVPNGKTKVATAHTHPNSDSFSNADKKNAARRGLDSYVIGPSLELQKYSVDTFRTSSVGTAKPVILSEAQKAALVSEFRVSWDSHTAAGCGFGCDSMVWPTP